VLRDILTDAQQTVLELLNRIPEVRSFYLAGGTALALHLGHRRSRDFDFFRAKEFAPQDFLSVLRDAGELDVFQEATGTLTVGLRGVPVSFFHYAYPLLRPLHESPWAISVADPEDIAALGIGYVIEGRGIFPELTVEENLALGAYRRRGPEIRADVGHVHTLFPVLRERSRQLAGTLSGGEQQMLAIGRALLLRPRLLMLDEPSLGLAPLLVREIFRTIAGVNRDGTAILLVEQNAHMALSIAHYGCVLESGRLVLEGSAADLAENPNVQELYLGVTREPSIKGWKRYKVRRRWA